VALRRLTWKGLPLLAVAALLVGLLVAAAQAAPAQAAPAQAAPAQAAPAQAGDAASASSGPEVNPDHVKVLAAALKKMRDHYAALGNVTPGPQDVFDYNIGNLWLRGIDGTGTTAAVIEGWDDPGIAAFLHASDLRYGLPDPVIQTIYPSGPLPAQCPAGMMVLGSYGSCDAWQGELELDVLTVHLIAPYAKIVISATPADSEIADDPASNVAPPEMMRALEYIGARHIANVISISDGTGEITYSFGDAAVNPVLYDILGPLGPRAGISDVVRGNDSVIDPKTGKVLVTGFTAGPGFDVASGWGTIDASRFVPALTAATQASGLDLIARHQASRELSRLEHSIRLSAWDIPDGGTSSVSGTGFLPRHPIRLAIDGAVITTLTASDLGTASYELDPAALGLAPGHHVLTLQGMLITTVAGFHSG
jgi:hypothetical protein